MREIDARVTGFDYTTFHAYTTEVEVDSRTWTLGIRYNTFYHFYMRLTALEKHFTVDFPPKGGLFFSPPPEERQEQLDDFLLSTLAYFDMRGHPKRMEALLGELLQIPEHLGIKDDDGERTASEGSSVAEELLLDTPLPGHEDDHDDFLESGQEHDYHDVQEDNSTPQQIVEDNQVEVVVEVAKEATEELKADAFQEPQKITAEANCEEEVVDLETKPEAVEVELEVEAAEEMPEAEQVAANVVSSPKPEDKMISVERQQSQELTGGSVAKDYIAMLRRKSLVDGAIQAAVVSIMKENVEKSKADKVEKAGEEQTPVNEEKDEVNLTKAVEVHAEVEPTEPAKSETQEITSTKSMQVETEQHDVEEQLAAPTAEEQLTAPEWPAVQTEAIPVKIEATETPVFVVEVSEAVSPTPMAVSREADLDETAVSETEQNTAVPASTSETEGAEPAVPADSVQEDESSSDESDEVNPEPTKKEVESEDLVMSWFRRMGTFGSSAAEKEEQEVAAAKKEQEEKEAAARAEAEAKAKEDAETTAQKEADTAQEKATAEAKEAAEAELLHAEQELNLRLKSYRHPVFFQGFNCDVGTSRYSLAQRLSDGIII